MPTAAVTTVVATTSIFDNAIVAYILKILGALLVILLLLMISKIIANFVQKKIIKSGGENKHIDKVGKLVHDVTFYILVIFSFFIGFEMVGFNVGLILGGISFGVGLAFKEILGNMVAGIMILYTKEFRIGDIVEINADQVYFGRIEEITIRYTIIRTLDLRQVVIPNTTLITSPIKTFSSEPVIKLTISVRASYDSDNNQVIEIMKAAVNSFDIVKDKENTKVFLSSFGDSSIEFKAFFSFDPNCGVLQEIALGQISQKIGEEFTKNKIEMPYNIMTLNFAGAEDQKKIADQVQA